MTCSIALRLSKRWGGWMDNRKWRLFSRCDDCSQTQGDSASCAGGRGDFLDQERFDISGRRSRKQGHSDHTCQVRLIYCRFLIFGKYLIQRPLGFVSNHENIKSQAPNFCCNLFQLTTVQKKGDFCKFASGAFCNLCRYNS